MATKQQCNRALEKYQGYLSSLKNVVGLGIVRKESKDGAELSSDKQYVVAVYVSKKIIPERLKKIHVVPKILELGAKKNSPFVYTCVIEQGEPDFEKELL